MKPKLQLCIMMLMALSLTACKRPAEPLALKLQQHNDTLHQITLLADNQPVDSLMLPYRVYHFDYADLTGDGVPEVIVGVIKKTRYWQTEDKRIFIYHLFKSRYIRPLWLGSRLGNPIKDFRVNKQTTPASIVTEEWDEDSTIIGREYVMGGFGLKYKGPNP